MMGLIIISFKQEVSIPSLNDELIMFMTQSIIAPFMALISHLGHGSSEEAVGLQIAITLEASSFITGSNNQLGNGRWDSSGHAWISFLL